MKNTKFTGFILIFTIIIFPIIHCSKDNKTMKDAISVIHERKSVRNFTGETVSKEDIETILKAGMAAPTAVNMQPWAFVVVTKRTVLDALNRELPYAKMLDKAGAAIIVCAIPDKAFQGKTEFALIDASLASENILLAAEALGLGALWTAVYPEADRMKVVRNILKIPDKIIPLNVIPIGKPTGIDKPKNKWNPKNIHQDTW